MSPAKDPSRLDALLVAALDGDEAALTRLGQRKDLDDIASRHRLVGALGLLLGPFLERSRRRSWQQFLRSETARSLLLEDHLQRLGKVLGSAAIPWMVFKGMDLRSRAYDHPAQRPVSDIDILLDRKHYSSAQSVLREAGWTDTFSGTLNERFLQDEGYCWNVTGRDGTHLEVHFRLWGMVPEDLSSVMLARGLDAPELGPTARRPRWPDAYLIAAVHLWMSSPADSLLSWWDLERISAAAERSWALEVIEEAKAWDLQLPLILAAAGAHHWWPEGEHQRVAEALEPSLKRLEKRVFSRAQKDRSWHRSSLKVISLARLFSGRRSRSGWRILYRPLWAHGGIVERETPRHRPWAWRRLQHFVERIQSHIG